MTRRKDGLWQQQLTIIENGRKKQRCFYGRTKQEVLAKIATYRTAAESGETFQKVADEWWAEHEGMIAYNTRKGYRPAYRRACAYFGKTYINQLRPADVNVFLSDFIRSTQAADKTARTQLMVINLICRYGVQNGFLDANPARDLTVPRNLKKETRRMPRDEDLLRVKSSTGCTFGMFAYWLMYTGCRRGELLALTWEDVDLEARTISITKSVYHDNNRPCLKAPKSESGRRVLPIMDKLLEKLTPGKGIIFPNDKGELLSETQFQRLWELYCRESGVTATPHQLRHAYTVMLTEAGVEPEDAQILLGHAQLSTTMDIYNEIRERKKKKVRDALLHIDIV